MSKIETPEYDNILYETCPSCITPSLIDRLIITNTRCEEDLLPVIHYLQKKYISYYMAQYPHVNKMLQLKPERKCIFYSVLYDILFSDKYLPKSSSRPNREVIINS